METTLKKSIGRVILVLATLSMLVVATATGAATSEAKSKRCKAVKCSKKGKRAKQGRKAVRLGKSLKGGHKGAQSKPASGSNPGVQLPRQDYVYTGLVDKSSKSASGGTPAQKQQSVPRFQPVSSDSSQFVEAEQYPALTGQYQQYQPPLRLTEVSPHVSLSEPEPIVVQ